MDYARPELLADTGWLAAHLSDPEVRLIDCGFLDAYNRAHIPGAVGLPVHHYIKEPDPAGGPFGVHVMAPAEFEALMGSLGVGDAETVVVYDDDSSRPATRLWWVLNYYGHTNVKVLNGGWHKWVTEGRPITFHAPAVAPAAFHARTNAAIRASAEYLGERLAAGACQVLDARSDDEWQGTEDRGNRRAGHVPGARHMEWSRCVDPGDLRTFLSAAELERLVREAGIARDRETVTYCQAGVRAAHVAFVLALLGFEKVRVYDGSMREWANRRETPLTLG